MDFVSLVFLAWAASFILVSGITPNRYFPYLLTVFGVAFVFSKTPLAGAVLTGESLLCYFVCSRRLARRWIFSVLAVAFVFVAFLLCKYLAGKNSLALPLGISYFTFRLIHYVQENYRQRLRDHTLPEFLAYMAFFPTYVVGPINLFPGFLKDMRRRHRDPAMFSRGLERMVYGYAQLVILGNFLLNHVGKNWMTVSLAGYTGFTGLCIQSVYLWLDLYIRFSAYSSIAIGISAMAGFTVPENFNYPFLAPDIREFWKRWHMSLTDWCREYIFKPVAAITRMPWLAISATMVTIGIWHELSLRYILWGVYHSLGIIIFEKYSLLRKEREPRGRFMALAGKTAGIVITMVFVVLSFPVTSLVNNFIMNLIR